MWSSSAHLLALANCITRDLFRKAKPLSSFLARTASSNCRKHTNACTIFFFHVAFRPMHHILFPIQNILFSSSNCRKHTNACTIFFWNFFMWYSDLYVIFYFLYMIYFNFILQPPGAHTRLYIISYVTSSYVICHIILCHTPIYHILCHIILAYYICHIILCHTVQLHQRVTVVCYVTSS